MVSIADVTATPSPDLLTPDNCAVLFVDHQPQMFFGTGSGDRTAIINATVGLARAARRSWRTSSPGGSPSTGRP